MKKYSVLLLYPSSGSSPESYLAHVSVKPSCNINDVITIAQKEAAEGCEYNPEDFDVMLVVKGHVEDLS